MKINGEETAHQRESKYLLEKDITIKLHTENHKLTKEIN